MLVSARLNSSLAILLTSSFIKVNSVSIQLYFCDRAGQLAIIEGHRLLHPPQALLVVDGSDEQSFDAVGNGHRRAHRSCSVPQRSGWTNRSIFCCSEMRVPDLDHPHSSPSAYTSYSRQLIFVCLKPMSLYSGLTAGPHQRPRIHLLMAYSSPSAYTSIVGMELDRRRTKHERRAVTKTDAHPPKNMNIEACRDENTNPPDSHFVCGDFRTLGDVTNDLEYTYSSPSAYTSIHLNFLPRNEVEELERLET
ncbi:hypothetical protein ONZ45_g19257 [Pleurotus djamor]|nr:hypothetical protein ONZ45_g19257 [Pleurotus djamor]